MKRLIVTIFAAALLAGTAVGQENFRRAWALDLGAGASYTFGSDPERWSDPLSWPSLAIGAIYNVSPAFAVRGELAGYKASAGIPAGRYSWYQGQLSADAILNFRGLGGWQSGRVFNPYGFLGVGFNRRTGNDDAMDMSAAFPDAQMVWKRPVTSFAGRVGLGAAWRISKTASIKVEVVDNVLPDEFNSYKGKDLWPGDGYRLAVDNMLTALVGVRLDLGVKKYERRVAEAAAAEAAAAAAAAARAAARERAAAEAAAAAEAERAAAEAAAAEEAARRAAAEAEAALPTYEESLAAALADPDRHVLFTIGSTKIRQSEQSKIEAVAQALSEDGTAKVRVIGYADAQTGSHAQNLYISKYRARAVAAALQELGVCPDRITIDFVGDEEQVDGGAEANRLALCVVHVK